MTRIGKVLNKVCLYCGNTFLTFPSHFKRRKYCSHECNARANKPRWKGSDVGYVALHMWVAKYLGKPTTCEHCGKIDLKGSKIHWANKSREYKRDLSDWIRLCALCHSKYDRG